MSTTFGQIFRDKRRTAGVSQRRLAELAGVDFSYISKVENGRLPPPAADTLARLAKVIACPAEELLAAAQKLPTGVETRISGDPAAVRFLQEASDLNLTGAEWEHMRGTLRSLQEMRSRPRRTR